jgi:hypothetical protein
MFINDYSINNYWWLLVSIILMAIGGYFIGGYSIGGYSINGYEWLFY